MPLIDQGAALSRNAWLTGAMGTKTARKAKSAPAAAAELADALTSAPAGLPLGTEVASDLLGVSRPWLTTLINRGDISSSKVGSKRRIRLGDLLAYRRCDDTRRRERLTWEFLDEE